MGNFSTSQPKDVPRNEEILDLHNEGFRDAEIDTSRSNRRITDMFNAMDTSNDGQINRSELVDAIQQHHVALSDEYLQHLYSLADTTQQDPLNFDDFVRLCRQKEDRLRQVFDAIDHGGDGQLHREEIREALHTLGLNVTDIELDEMIQHVDRDGDGTVTWQEWRDALYWMPDRQLTDLFEHWRTLATSDPEFAVVESDEEGHQSRISGTWWKHFLAGGIAGAISRTCTAPLDRLKVISQVGAIRKNLGLFGGIKSMIQEGGWRSLWRGNLVNVIKIGPESAIKFWAWEAFKNLLYNEEQVSIFRRIAAGALAGLTAQVTIFPLEVIKTRMAASKTSQYRSIFHCARVLHQQLGLKAFYRGLTPAMVGVIPFAGIDFAVYERLKVAYCRTHEGQMPSNWALLGFGAVSSSCGQLVSYPLALVRTRVQADANNNNNFVQELRHVYRNGGVTSLYRGLGANFLKVAPAVSITYVVFEHVKEIL